MSRIKIWSAFGAILAMSLVFAAGASAAKEKRALEFMFEGPTGNEPVPVGDDVQVDSTGTIAFEVGPWTVECAQGALSGTVHEVAANEMQLSLTSAAVSGPGREGACKSTAGNAYITVGPLPWANTLTTNHKATLKPQGEAKYLTFTLGLTPEGKDEEVKCAYTASAVKSSFSKEEEPIALVSGRVTLKVAKASDAECPKTGAILEAKWSVKAAAPKSESFYPVVLNSVQERRASSIPAPPPGVGCSSYEEGTWKESECISGLPPQNPPFEVLAIYHGKSSNHIRLGALSYDADAVDTESFEHRGSDPSLAWGTVDSLPLAQWQGPGAYGLQLNTNTFTGGNDETDWVQFADGVEEDDPVLGVAAVENDLCIEQWDIPKYEAIYHDANIEQEKNREYIEKGAEIQVCHAAFSSDPLHQTEHANIHIEGYTGIEPHHTWVYRNEYGTHEYHYNGNLTVVWDGWKSGKEKEEPFGKEVTVPDVFELGHEKKWVEAEGSLYGRGNRSKAEFANSTIEIELGASTCEGYAPFNGFVWPLAENCAPSEAMKPDADVAISELTGESSNLKPVVLPHAPPLLYSSNYAVNMDYVATPTGHCLTPSEHGPYCLP